MRHLWIGLLAGASALALGLSAAEPAPGGERGRTRLVTVQADGRIAYQSYTARGDVLPDFSHCGYRGGGIALPTVPVREELSPAPEAGDDTARIQAALDRVGALPADAAGWRGAVLLGTGVYRLAGQLHVRHSGVVLRGAGMGPEGTTLVSTTRQREPVIAIGGARGPQESAQAKTEIADDYVPVGATSFRVHDAAGFAPGQTVFVVRRGNAAWIREIGMDRIPQRPQGPESQQWKPFDLKFDRVITAVEGNVVTIDAPIACAIERPWGGGALVRYDDPERIEHCGVEDLQAVSVVDLEKRAKQGGETILVDEDHATHLVSFGAVKNAWARRLATKQFYHGPAMIQREAKWITVEGCVSLEPVSTIQGQRRYAYHIEGQLALVRDCQSDRSRHAFVFGSRVPGPNVFLDCRSTRDYSSSEPHHRWSVGGLYDNVSARIAIQDRLWMGSGHGWSGANYVAWNCRGSLIVQKPPTAQNFAIGFVGQRGKEAFPGRQPGWWESEGAFVTPRSLYEAQLAARLTDVE